MDNGISVRHRRRFLWTALWLFFAVAQLGAVPGTIRFQGRLTDSGGNPIVGPEVRVRFALFSAESGGAAVWEGPASQTAATNDAGLFTADVGPFPDRLFMDNPNLYIQVSVHDGTGMKALLPRQKLASVPYALHTENVADDSISAAKIQSGAVTEEKIPDGSILESKIKEHSIGTVAISTEVLAALIPSGMVAMFARECPAGWLPFEEMTGRFPLGVEDAIHISSGGAAAVTGLYTVASGSHSHQVNAHSHSIPLASVDHQHVETIGFTQGGPNGRNLVSYLGAPWGTGGPAAGIPYAWYAGLGDPLNPGPGEDWNFVRTSGATDYRNGPTGNSAPGTDVSPSHEHQIISDGSWRPPYHGIIFCEKR